MTTIERLEVWKQAGVLTDTQYGVLSSLARRSRFSVFIELNALLYLGVISFVAGLGWTIQTHFKSLGDIFILAILSSILAGSLYYTFSRAPAYSNQEVESPNLVFDYVLYLACLVFSVELGYIEFRFEWLKDSWDYYLLLSSAVFFVFAYRFDNRFVLSLGLSTLAAFIGIKATNLRFANDAQLRSLGLLYSFVISLIGVFMHRQRIKRHFLETYLHVAANVSFIALLSGVSGNNQMLYLLGLVMLSTAVIVLGIHYRRFAFVVYGTVFGYIGISTRVLREVREFSLILGYLVLSGLAVILSIAFLARRFGREV